MLVRYNFVDAERRRDTPRKEAKDFNTYDTADSMNFMFMKFFWPPRSYLRIEGIPGGCCPCSGESQLKKPQSFKGH